MAKYAKTKKPDGMSQEEIDEIVPQLVDFHDAGEEGNQEMFKRMSKCERYAVGQQWDREVLEANEKKRKFSLTINRIFPIINQLSGFDAKNPKDIKASNLRGGTQKGAEILTALTKHALDINHSTRQQNQCFEDGVRCARGYIEIDVDYDEDPLNGNILVEKLDPFNVIPDPTCKSYNFNDPKQGAKYLIIEKWVDKGYIQSKYADKVGDLADTQRTSRRFTGLISGLTSWMFGGSDYRENQMRITFRDRELDVDKESVADFTEHKYLVSKYYWKTFEAGAYLVKDGDFLHAMVLNNEKDIAEAKKLIKDLDAQREQAAAILEQQQGGTPVGVTPEGMPDIPNVELVEYDKNGNRIVVTVLHRALMVGQVLLEHQRDPFNGMTLIPVVRFSPYFVNGYEFSVVENLIGPQDQVNWAWSMELNLIRKLANAGWRIAKDVTGKFKAWLQDHSSEDGVVIDESEGGGSVNKLEANPFPTNYDIVTEKGSRFITEISQVRLEEPNPANESGRAVLARQNWSLQNVSNLSGNWDYTLELLGEILVGVIRNTRCYSEAEVMAVIDEAELIDEDLLNESRNLVVQILQQKGFPPVPQPEQPDVMVLQGMTPAYQKAVLYNYKKQAENFTAYMQEIDKLAMPMARAKLIDEISSVKYGKYGIKAELSPHAETNRITRMVELFELHRTLVESGQPGVGRNELIDATNIHNKDAVKASIPVMPAAPAAKAKGA